MASSNPYEGSTFSWTSYGFRPPYPQSMLDLFMTYHAAHSNKIALAHDIGTGNGAFAYKLVNDFSKLHLSDPSSDNLVVAKRRMDMHDYWGKRITYSATGAAEADRAVPGAVLEEAGGGVDFVSVMEAMHWVGDVATAIQAIAHSLKPGGTLAVGYYCPQPRFLDNEKASDAFEGITEAIAQQVLSVPGSIGRKGQSQAFTGLDFVPLPEDLFERSETRRIRVNTRGVKRPYQYGKEGLITPAPSMVEDDEKIELFDDEEGPSKGWKHQVEWPWFQGYLASLTGYLQIKDTEEVKKLADDLKGALGDRKWTVTWDVAIILATKKK